MKKLPPKLAHRILLSFLREDLAEDVAGDLEERFFLKLNTSSLLSARIDYWRQVLNYVRPFAIRKLSYQALNSSPMMYRSYFKTAWRSMIKNKMLAVINITGLAIGMAVTMVLSFWIWDELGYNKMHANHAKLAQVVQNVTNNGEVATWTSVPFPLAEEIRKNYGSDFDQVVMTTGSYPNSIAINDKKFSKTGLFAEPGFFEMFSLRIISGDLKSAIDPSSVFLSQSTAKAIFGEADPLNQILTINESITAHVAGVYEDIPEGSRFSGNEFIGPWEMLYNSSPLKTIDDPWRPNSFDLYVQLTDQADFISASEKIRDAKLRKVSEALAKKKPALFLHPMDQWHLYSEFRNGKQTGGRIQYVWLFGIIAGFVLIMACVNFMNLTTSKSEQRAKEVGIRKSIGSLRSQLMSQFVSESVMTCFISFLIALLVVTISLPTFNLLADKNIHIDWSNPVFWFITIGFCIFTGLIAGSYPAFYLSSIDPSKALKGSYKAGAGAAMFRKGLVVMQFTISVVLIVGTVTVYRQIQYARNRPVGYDKDALVSLRVAVPEIHSHFDAFRDELLKSGSVLAVAESYSPPTSGAGSTSQLDWKGKDPNLSVDFNFFGGSADYGKTIAWEIIAGRDFDSDILSDTAALLLNESAVNYMGFKEPLGEIIQWRGQPMTVVGVIRDMVFGSPYDPVRPSLYSMTRNQAGFITMRISKEQSATTSIARIEEIFKKYVPAEPFSYRFADVEFDRKFGNEARVGKLSTMFTSLAIFISCLGIFGLSSFVAERRTKEIGVRKVMGASVFNLWKMLCGDFVVLVIISCIIAVPFAYYSISSWLMNYNYRTPFPWWMLGGAALATLLITLITVSYHTLKAANMKPVTSLRSE